MGYRYRVGFGQDIHKLVESNPLILGGVTIPFEKGEEAYSDGDVLYHALCDALLGAMSKGNIGTMFPNDDPKYKDIDSSKLVKEICELVRKGRFYIENIDICIQLEAPLLNPYIDQMKKNIYSLLRGNIDGKKFISIKPGTNEGLGEIGKGEAVSASACVLLRWVE